MHSIDENLGASLQLLASPFQPRHIYFAYPFVQYLAERGDGSNSFFLLPIQSNMAAHHSPCKPASTLGAIANSSSHFESYDMCCWKIVAQDLFHNLLGAACRQYLIRHNLVMNDYSMGTMNDSPGSFVQYFLVEEKKTWRWYSFFRNLFSIQQSVPWNRPEFLLFANETTLHCNKKKIRHRFED